MGAFRGKLGVGLEGKVREEVWLGVRVNIKARCYYINLSLNLKFLLLE